MCNTRDFLADQGTLPFHVGGVGLIPGQALKVPHASWPKNQNMKSRSNIVTNSIKTLEMVHVKKKKKKKHKSPEGSGSQEGKMVGLWTGDAKNGQAFEEP